MANYRAETLTISLLINSVGRVIFCEDNKAELEINDLKLHSAQKRRTYSLHEKPF